MKKAILCTMIGLLFAGVVSAVPSNGPANPGNSGVYRVSYEEEHVCAIFIDTKAQLLVAADLGNSMCRCQEWTENPPNFEQDVWISDEFVHLVFLTPAHPAHVYDYSGSPPVDCELIMNVTGRLVATGTASTMIRYSDAFGYGPGATTFGFKTSGTLFNIWGGEGAVHLNAQWRGVILPDGTLKKVVWSNIQLGPDPR